MKVCGGCGSDNVYYAAWVHLYDGSVTEPVCPDHYCGDCCTVVQLEDQYEFEQKSYAEKIEENLSNGE